LKAQFERAVVSIVLNLSEGSARKSQKERRRFYEVAFGSIRECQSALEMALEKDPVILKTLDKLAATTYQLCKSLKSEKIT